MTEEKILFKITKNDERYTATGVINTRRNAIEVHKMIQQTGDEIMETIMEQTKDNKELSSKANDIKEMTKFSESLKKMNPDERDQKMKDLKGAVKRIMKGA